MNMPQKLGKYEIRRELGSGAMGIVYEGWDPAIGRRVAIKTVKREQLDRAEVEEVLARFRREAQAAGRLSHPNIVSIYEFGEDGGTSFIAMEFIEGRELKDRFDAEERFPLPQVVHIMAQLLAALDHAHKNGVVHRDIKPANIILLPDGTVKVADFGIARIESSNLTQAGSVLGTPSYMSPEQFMGQTVDGRSDLYSAGVILYQFLTGEKPFTGALTTIMHKVLNEDPPAPSILNVQVPRPFDALVRKAMAKRPDERFENGREFADALADAASRPTTDADATLIGDADATVVADRTQAVDRSVAERSVPATTTPPTATPPTATPGAPRRTGLPLAAVAGVVGAAVIAGGAWLMLGKTHDSAPPPAAATAPVAPAPAPSPAPSASGGESIVITAVGLADPSDPRYQQDKGLMQADLREDVKRQLVEKAAALYVSQSSLDQNYALVQARLLARSGDFIKALADDGAPRMGKDGLATLAAKATIDVRQVQKSLNQMSRDERVDFIRNNGDPKISVAITAKSAEGDPSAAAPRSPVAENLLKEKIQSFGFRIWADEGHNGADFAVTGEARFKKLSAKLEASGITIEKFVLTSWTVKCTDRKSGEEIYYNTQIPEKTSWATEEQALRDIGKLIGDEFSKNFFLQHFHFAGQAVKLRFQGLPGKETAEALLREMQGLRGVLSVAPAGAMGPDAVFDAQLSGGMVAPSELVQGNLVTLLNRKLGKTCFAVTGTGTAEVTVGFEKSCGDPAVLGRLESLPPASLMAAPQSRRDAVVKNPETLKRLSV